MRLPSSSTFAALTVFMTACAPAANQMIKPVPANEVPGYVLGGTWEGPLVASTTDSNGLPVSFKFDLKIEIAGRGARVYVRKYVGETWQEQAVPDGFVFNAMGTNAVIYANRAGRTPPDGSRWFETYLVAASVKSPDQLLVHWMRMVTNLDTPVDDPDHAGTSSADGVLSRH